MSLPRPEGCVKSVSLFKLYGILKSSHSHVKFLVDMSDMFVPLADEEEISPIVYKEPQGGISNVRAKWCHSTEATCHDAFGYTEHILPFSRCRTLPR